MEDIKPPRGSIPDVPTSMASIAKHEFFKVTMFAEDEEMTPLTVEKPENELIIQRFIAIPGKRFHIKIEYGRPPPTGILYGCRVYVDQGGLDHRHVFDVTRGVISGHTNAEGKSVDESEPDHYFWIGANETSYDLRGYYRSSSESYEFSFGNLQPDPNISYLDDEDELERQKNQVGIIRLQFARVKEMVKRHDNKASYPSPAPICDDRNGILHRKGLHVATRPGKRIKTDEPTDKVAVLEEEICYEARLYFNDIFGYVHQPSILYKSPERLRAFPLQEFTGTKENRRRYIDLFLNWLQSERYYNRIDGDTSSNMSSRNEAVGTEDLVHFMSSALSPAASYILCTGKSASSFGEKLVQRSKRATARELASHFAEKEVGLVSFLANDPLNYILVESGRDDQNRLLHTVKRAELVISDSDSESDADT